MLCCHLRGHVPYSPQQLFSCRLSVRLHDHVIVTFQARAIHRAHREWQVAPLKKRKRKVHHKCCTDAITVNILIYTDIKGEPVPQLALQNVDFSVHAVLRLVGILQLPLQLPTVGVGPGHLLLRLLQLTFQLTCSAVQFVRLQTERRLIQCHKIKGSFFIIGGSKLKWDISRALSLRVNPRRIPPGPCIAPCCVSRLRPEARAPSSSSPFVSPFWRPAGVPLTQFQKERSNI